MIWHQDGDYIFNKTPQNSFTKTKKYMLKIKKFHKWNKTKVIIISGGKFEQWFEHQNRTFTLNNIDQSTTISQIN